MALTDNLISVWEMDEASGDAIDAHGSNDLTDTNTVAAAAGKINGARDFETGNSECFLLADNTDLSMGDIDFSITAWVQLESKTADRSIVGKYTESNQEYYLWYYQTVDRFRFQINDLGSAGAGGTETVVNADNLGSPSTATWYFLVATYNAGTNTISLSVNDGTADTASHSGGAYNGAAQFRIGAIQYPTIESYFDGLIDQVAIWKRVITGSEITQLYNSGNGLAYTSWTGETITMDKWYNQGPMTPPRKKRVISY